MELLRDWGELRRRFNNYIHHTPTLKNDGEENPDSKDALSEAHPAANEHEAETEDLTDIPASARSTHKGSSTSDVSSDSHAAHGCETEAPTAEDEIVMGNEKVVHDSTKHDITDTYTNEDEVEMCDAEVDNCLGNTKGDSSGDLSSIAPHFLLGLQEASDEEDDDSDESEIEQQSDEASDVEEDSVNNSGTKQQCNISHCVCNISHFVAPSESSFSTNPRWVIDEERGTMSLEPKLRTYGYNKVTLTANLVSTERPRWLTDEERGTMSLEPKLRTHGYNKVTLTANLASTERCTIAPALKTQTRPQEPFYGHNGFRGIFSSQTSPRRAFYGHHSSHRGINHCPLTAKNRMVDDEDDELGSSGEEGEAEQQSNETNNEEGDDGNDESEIDEEKTDTDDNEEDSDDDDESETEQQNNVSHFYSNEEDSDEDDESETEQQNDKVKESRSVAYHWVTDKRKGRMYHTPRAPKKHHQAPWLGKGKKNIFTKTEERDFSETEKHSIMMLVEDWKDNDRQEKQQEKNDMRQLIRVLKEEEERSTAKLIEEGKMHTNDMRDLIKQLVTDDMALNEKKRKFSRFALYDIEQRECELLDLPNHILKNKCKNLSLKVSGNKADLVNRIVDEEFGVWVRPKGHHLHMTVDVPFLV
eukprot:scaffold70564_cov62-Cyclotella_meneghiniana.AAC.3